VRRRRGADVRTVVPTAVRVEAGWDRREARTAHAGRMRVRDAVLDTPATDEATRIRAAARVSVADAHVGAVIAATPEGSDLTILTTDPDDMRRVAGVRRVTIVRL
jgi:predicted nucleic acid-binding protein